MKVSYKKLKIILVLKFKKLGLTFFILIWDKFLFFKDFFFNLNNFFNFFNFLTDFSLPILDLMILSLLLYFSKTSILLLFF